MLYRSPADPGTMRGQLEHLLDLGAMPNISILVIPFAAGPYPTDGNGPFVMLDSELVGRRITSVETSIASTYLETPEDNARYEAAWQQLTERALGPEETAEMIRGLLKRNSFAPR